VRLRVRAVGYRISPLQLSATSTFSMKTPNRRSAMLALTSLSLLPTLGCTTTQTAASSAVSDAQADPRHCFRLSRNKVSTCTTGPASPPSVDAQARRLEPHPELFTLYVVRKRWSDVRNVVDVVQGAHRIGTVPDSFVRLRLAPGQHDIAFDWAGQRVALPVTGGAGEVRVVELAGSIRAWGASYQWVTNDEVGARARLRSCRLVADIG
jgi:hypothetical protein